MSPHILEIGKKVHTPLSDGSVFSVGLSDSRDSSFDRYSRSPNLVWVSSLYDIVGCLVRLGPETPADPKLFANSESSAGWAIHRVRQFDLNSLLRAGGSMKDGLLGVRFCGMWNENVAYCAERIARHPDSRIHDIIASGFGARCSMIEFDEEVAEMEIEAFDVDASDLLVQLAPAPCILSVSTPSRLHRS